MTQAAILAASGSPGTTTGFKNRIINGNMVIDQRNAGASINPTDGQYSVDRWKCRRDLTSKYTIQQSTTAPTGFSNSILVTSSSAYSVPSSGYYFLLQAIEGFNTADLGWGTANAKTVTLSFQVYSSLTGTFGGSLNNSAENYSYPFSYSIPTANTWTTISVTIAGPTAGTWIGSTNGNGINVNFGLGVGSSLSGTAGAWAAAGYYSATGATSVVGTSGATFYLTGCQLEVGTTATNFDFRSYGTELSLCQRYFQMYKNGTANGPAIGAFTQAINSTDSYGAWTYIQTMRASPTLAYGGTIRVVDQSSGFTITALSFLANETSNYIASLRAQTASGMTTYRIYNINNSSDANAYISISAEL
jgi:hypothetical protein